MDLAASSVVSRMFRHLERSCPPWEICPLDWNLSLVLRCLSRSPFELVKLASDKHLTWKMSILLALVSVKRVSELHDLSFRVHHLRRWKLCAFLLLPDFVAKTQNPSVPDSCFKEFSVPSVDDFVEDDRDELLMCTICALQRYLSKTEQHCPGIEGLFISTGWRKKRDSCNTISFWLHCHLHGPCLCFRGRLSLFIVRAHEVRKVATSLLFKRNCVVHQVLKAGTWSAQSTFSIFYLRDVTTDTWTPSSLVLWRWLSRSCNLLTLLGPV